VLSFLFQFIDWVFGGTLDSKQDIYLYLYWPELDLVELHQVPDKNSKLCQNFRKFREAVGHKNLHS
jgi:hypothetical protein